MSASLHLPVPRANWRHAPFLQYMGALAVVEAVCGLPGGYKVPALCGNMLRDRKHSREGLTVLGAASIPMRVLLQDLPLSIKWPNDIYLRSSSSSSAVGAAPSSLHKLGGVLTTSTMFRDKLYACVGKTQACGRVIAAQVVHPDVTQGYLACSTTGIGVNVSNSAPAVSLNSAIRDYNAANPSVTPLAELDREVRQSRSVGLSPALLCVCVHPHPSSDTPTRR